MYSSNPNGGRGDLVHPEYDKFKIKLKTKIQQNFKKVKILKTDYLFTFIKIYLFLDSY